MLTIIMQTFHIAYITEADNNQTFTKCMGHIAKI